MFSFPAFLLISADEARNSRIRDLLKSDMTDQMNAMKKRWEPIGIKTLYDNLELAKLAQNWLLTALEIPHNVVESQMEQLDNRRLRDKARNVLTQWQIRARDLQAVNYGSYSFRDLVASHNNWDSHPYVLGTNLVEPQLIHGLVMSRLADLYNHVSISTQIFHEEILLHGSSVVSPKIQTSSKASREITKELVGYLAFMNNL